MDKEQLSQLRYLRGELEIIKQQITDLETAGFYADDEVVRIVTDTVRGSNPEFPYEPRTFVIKGLDSDGYGRKLGRLRQLLRRRAGELTDLLIQAHEYIDAIDDSLIRQIITLRHVCGLTWCKVAARVGGDNTAESVRKMHDRFFERGE